jgi:PRC-barrel domain protein
MAEPRTARYTDIVPAKKTVIGSKVVNAQNEDLGKIEDLVLDAGAGWIALVGQMPSPEGQPRTGQVDGVYKVFRSCLCPAPKLFLTPVVH